MNKKRLIFLAFVFIFSFALILPGLAKKKKEPTKIEPGTLKGKIDQIDPNYQKYGAEGWFIVKWDVEDPEDIDRRLLVVGGGSKEGAGIDCAIAKEDQALAFKDLQVGQQVEADYKMGYDALHCTAVRILKEASTQAETAPAATEESSPPAEE